MIENTSERMKDPASVLVFFAASMGPGGSDQAIAEQERQGQAQLAASDRLPTHSDSTPREDFEALGFVFGAPDPADPLFCPATLPEGWTREAADHEMWSYLVDGLGRRRANIFYKAAFYDRRASIGLISVASYVRDCVYNGADIVTDETWATPAAVAAAAREGIAAAQKRISDAVFFEMTDDIDKHTAERAAYSALAVRFGVSEA